MNRIIIGGLAIAMITGPAVAADVPTKAPVAPATGCRLPSGNQALFECPGLSVSLGVMASHRETTDGTIITPPTGTPGVVMSGSDFNFPWHWSPDVIARYRFGGGWSIDGRYFNSHPDDATFGIPAITTFRTAGIGVTILGGGSINGIYSSRIESTEFNVWKELVPNISVGAGYRHFNLHDVLRANLATPSTFVAWDDTNKLDGAQLGVNFGFAAPALPQLHFNTMFKGGVYHNSAANDFTSTIVSSSLNNAASKQALSAEADLTATYYITDRWSIQANYMALWLKDVALPDAAAQTTIQVGGGTSSPVAFNKLWYNAVSLRLGYDF